MRTTLRALGIGATLLMTGGPALAEESDPAVILKKVEAAYASMKTYNAQGMVTADIDHNGTMALIETSFSIKLKKPNLYLITWRQTTSMTPAVVQSGAVWSDGKQPYLYMGITNTYSKMRDDQMALGSATGISGGAALTIPSFFLPGLKTHASPFARLKNPTLGMSESVDGDDCYVISGSSDISKKETIWISKKTYLIRKYARSYEAPAGGRKIPQLTEQQLEEAIKATGQEATEERMTAMRKMMKQSEESLKTANLKGASTEFHTQITMPKLTAKQFAFKVPDGTLLKKSLLTK